MACNHAREPQAAAHSSEPYWEHLCTVAPSPELEDKIKTELAEATRNLSFGGAIPIRPRLPVRFGLNDGVIIPELFVPLGLRYHALHHLFPQLPYHALGRAHRRLMKELPAGSDYHQTVRSGIGAIFAQFWKNTWNKPEPSTISTRRR